MKKTLGVFLALLFSFAFCVSVWADGDKGQIADYMTDYYMIVESRNGGINIYAGADEDGGKLNNELIPNGTALHIKGEKKDTEGKEWGLTEYHGMKGFVLFKDLKPVTLSEAVKSELGVLGSQETDEDIVIGAKSGSVKMYTGPGEKFAEVSSAEILNGETVHISLKTETEDGETWGKVTGREKEGWINLSEARERQGTGRGSERAVDKKAPEPTGISQITSTPAPTEEPQATVTPAQTEAQEEKATPTPKETLQATATPAPAEAASSQSVDSVSALFMSPILWIVAAVILVVLVFLYFLKLK